MALPPHESDVGYVAHFRAEVSFDSDHVGVRTRRESRRSVRSHSPPALFSYTVPDTSVAFATASGI